MARRNDHSRDELREMALTAAEQLLDAQGAAALSTRKIAAAIGYSAGSLYQVFSNYDDLCWQLNQRTLTQLLATLEVAEQASPIDALQHYADNYLCFAQQQPERWQLLFEHHSKEPQLPDQLMEIIERLFALLEHPLATLFAGQQTLDIQQAARTLWAGVQGIAVLHHHDKLFASSQQSPQLMARQLIQRYIAGWQEEVK